MNAHGVWKTSRRMGSGMEEEEEQEEETEMETEVVTRWRSGRRTLTQSEQFVIGTRSLAFENLKIL